MLILPLEEAREGMTLAAPVTQPDRPSQVLLKQGFTLDAPILRRLSDLGISHIYVDYPGLEDLDRHLASILSPARQVVYNQIRQTIEACQRRTRPAISYTDYYASTRELVLTLMSDGKNPLFLDQMARMDGDAVGHATAVSHLALLLGIKLERYLIDQRKRLSVSHAKEVVNIGVAGMLHDIGKTKLPPELQNHHGMFPPEEEKLRNQWLEHVRIGYDMIHDGVEPSAASAVLCHHMRYDGRGWGYTLAETPAHPQGGRRLHIFARILFAADFYDRLCAHPTRPIRRSNLEVFHLMHTQYASWVDPVVQQMLETIAPPFPPGVKVELNDGSAGVVVRVEPADPYRPAIRRFQQDGVTLEESLVELRTQNGLAILSVGGQKVEGLLPPAVAA